MVINRRAMLVEIVIVEIVVKSPETAAWLSAQWTAIERIKRPTRRGSSDSRWMRWPGGRHGRVCTPMPRDRASVCLREAQSGMT
eukprot:786031-Pleurochrysis_carterae.AAC.2